MSLILLCALDSLSVAGSADLGALQVSGKYADSIYLFMTGIAMVLLSILVRGISDVTHCDSENLSEKKDCASTPPRVSVVAGRRGFKSSTWAQDSKTRVLLSVDVEDYFQTEVFSSIAPRTEWNTFPLRVVENTRRLLDLFDSFDAKATFFMLGWIAHRVPMLAQEIQARGHELACHSYWHRTVYSMSRKEFAQDTQDACKAIEDAAGMRVSGYRAPTWSITKESLWAMEVLAEHGFTYDSSIYPVKRDLYGIPGASRAPYLWKTRSGDIMEIPPATIKIGSSVVPAAGGGYLRIFPLAVSEIAIDQLARKNLLPVVYLHPWEIDPDQPRLQAGWKARRRQYTGLSSTEWKLTQLLQRYRFVPFSQAEQIVQTGSPQAVVSEVIVT